MGIGIYIKPNSCTVSGTSKLFNSSKMYYYCVDRIKPTVNITKVEPGVFKKTGKEYGKITVEDETGN